MGWAEDLLERAVGLQIEFFVALLFEVFNLQVQKLCVSTSSFV